MVKLNSHNNSYITVGITDNNIEAAPAGLYQTLLRRYFTMKYIKDLKKALGPLVDYLEESMAQYVESQDRIRHITTLDRRFHE